ncbi:hypothetical protein [Flavobacterium sp. GCM10023249]|uniref:hypothetical protein n=1 Tax=unclassified Flavobacterium TaxID=196869 RepID=UPI00360CF06E
MEKLTTVIRVHLKGIVLLLFTFSMHSQNVGVNTITPNAEAVLDIYCTDKGLLLPRLVLITTDNAAPLQHHVEGMIAYNTTASVGVSPVSVYEGLYYNDGTQWNWMGPNSLAVGDIKYSLETTDHKGWFLLNGRNTTTLPVVAQNNATGIGIGATLPNMDDRFIKTTNNSEAMQAIGGANTFALSQANLPNITYNVTTALSGDHSHNFTDSHNNAETLGLATNVLPLVPLITETVGTNDIWPTTLYTTVTNGNHSHIVTVPSGGGGQSINATPKHLVTNVFIYLGE